MFCLSFDTDVRSFTFVRTQHDLRLSFDLLTGHTVWNYQRHLRPTLDLIMLLTGEVCSSSLTLLALHCFSVLAFWMPASNTWPLSVSRDQDVLENSNVLTPQSFRSEITWRILPSLSMIWFDDEVQLSELFTEIQIQIKMRTWCKISLLLLVMLPECHYCKLVIDATRCFLIFSLSGSFHKKAPSRNTLTFPLITGRKVLN